MASSPAFFKILIDPSSPHLALPPEFVRRHLRDKIRQDPKVKIQTGDFSWPLKITKIGDNYCLAHGWNKLVQDAHLGFGDFLFFWFIDFSTFQVSIYDRNGCQKSLSSISNKQLSRRNGSQSLNVRKEIKIELDVENEGERGALKSQTLTPEQDDGGDYPGFQKIISFKTHRYILRLPITFVEEAGIAMKKSLILKDLKGNDWPINVHVEKAWRSKRYLSTGWPDFRRSNELLEGDICLFKFIKGKLVLTQVIKNQTPPKNGGFRPPPSPLAGKRHAMPSDVGPVKRKKEISSLDASRYDIKIEEE